MPTGEFRKNLDTWTLVNPEGHEWGKLALLNNQAFDQGIVNVTNEHAVDEIVDLGGQIWILEHFFEYRFAGALLIAATGRDCLSPAHGEDETLALSLRMLQAIVNHRDNLTWTTKQLNDQKTLFFGGLSI